MKKLLLLPCLLLGLMAVSQTPPGYTKISARYEWLATKADSGLHVPGYSTTPNIRTGVWVGAGNIGLDTVLHRLYFYSGGVMQRLAKYSEISGAGGNPNSNIGSGYRLAIPNTNNIKTFFVTPPLTIDSTSNANALTIGLTTDQTVDTVATYDDLQKYADNADILVVTHPRYGGIFKAVSSGTENGATLKVANDARKWQRVFDSTYWRPEWYEIYGKDRNGASYNRLTGTGIGSEAVAVKNIVLLAGANAEIRYINGKIYDIDQYVPVKTKQRHVGGQFKRAAPITTLLVNNEAINSTSIEVVDASNLRAGMGFLIKGAGTNGGYNDNSNGTLGNQFTPIISISGNTLTIASGNTGIVKAMLAGDTLTTVTSFLYRQNSIGTASDSDNIVYVDRMTFDGNKSQNRYFVDWQQPASVEVIGGVLYSNQCVYKNTPGENIFVTGGTSTDDKMFYLEGSCFHWSNVDQTLDSIYLGFVVTNLYADSVGLGNADEQFHSEGSVGTGSLHTNNATFINCTVKNAGSSSGPAKQLWGYNAADDGITKVIGGYYENSKALAAFIGMDSTTAKGEIFSITDATFKNCGAMELTGTDARKGNTIPGVTITGNTFTNVRFYFQDLVNLNFSNNTVTYDSLTYRRWDNTLAFQTGGGTFPGIAVALRIAATCDRVTVRNNSFSGFANDTINTAIETTLDNAVVAKNLTVATLFYYGQNYDISENKFNGFRYTLATGLTAYTKATVGWKINNNFVAMGKGPAYATDYTEGLRIPPGAVADGNTVINFYNTNASSPFIAEGVSANQTNLMGATLTNNKTFGLAVYSINISPGDASPYNVVLKSNLRQSGAIAGGTLGLANSFRSGNDIMDSTNLPALTAPLTPFTHKVGENKANY